MSATSGGVKAGKAFIVIEALDKTSTVINTVGAKFQSLGKNIKTLGNDLVKSFGQSIAGIGKQMALIAGYSAIPLALSAKTFAGFDDSMRRVEARSKGTAEEMEALRNQAKELGRTTAFTASQVGDLQSKLAQKGFSRKDIGQMTEGVVNLALAGGSGSEEDPTLAADLVSGALKSWKMDASQSGKVADLFTAAVNNSNFGLQSLIDTFKYVGPIAKEYGRSLEEAIAISAQMVDVNIEASSAGMAYRNVLLEMSDPAATDKFNKRLKELTGKTVEFIKDTGDLKALPDVMFEIGEAMKGLGTAQRGEVLNMLFGKRAIVPASVIASSENPFKSMMEVLAGSNGLAEKTRKTMEEGLGGSFRSLMSAVEGVAISIGEALEPTLIPLVAKINNVLQIVSRWIEQNQGLVVSILGGLAALGSLGAALFAGGTAIAMFGGAIAAIGSIIAGIGTVLGMLATPVGAVVAILGVLAIEAAASFAVVMAKSQDLRDSVVGAFQSIVSTVTDIGGGIADAFQAGDLDLAWKIAMQGMKLLWLQTLNDMLDIAAKWGDGLRKMFIENVKMAMKAAINPMALIGEAAGASNPLMAIMEEVAMLDTNESIAREKLNALQLEALKKRREREEEAKAKAAEEEAKAAEEEAKAVAKRNRMAPVKAPEVPDDEPEPKDPDLSLAEIDRWEAAGREILNDLTNSLGAIADVEEAGDKGTQSVLSGLAQGSLEAATQAIENQIRAEADKDKGDVQEEQLAALKNIDNNLKNNVVIMEPIA